MDQESQSKSEAVKKSGWMCLFASDLGFGVIAWVICAPLTAVAALALPARGDDRLWFFLLCSTFLMSLVKPFIEVWLQGWMKKMNAENNRK